MLNTPAPPALQRTVGCRGSLGPPYGERRPRTQAGNCRSRERVRARPERGCLARRVRTDQQAVLERKEEVVVKSQPPPPRGPRGALPGSWAPKPRQVALALATTQRRDPLTRLPGEVALRTQETWGPLSPSLPKGPRRASGAAGSRFPAELRAACGRGRPAWTLKPSAGGLPRGGGAAVPAPGREGRV